MKRLHLFEIEDQDWCPNTIRDITTDYLQFGLAATNSYAPIIPLLAAALQRTETRCVLDLCSGGAGPWLCLRSLLAKQGMNVSVCLSDKYPNLEAFKWCSRISRQTIRYHPEPVDATKVPPDLPGLRTVFTAFHHFRPEQAFTLLADAVKQRRGIGVFEVTRRHPLPLFLMPLAPLMMLVVTPFIRPFRWSRLFWTYLIPLAPIVTLFDGVVSCFRTYSVKELQNLIKDVGARDYQWDIGTVRGEGLAIPITYLVGLPVD